MPIIFLLTGLLQQKHVTMNDQILQLSNELTQSTSDYALANQKFGELQCAYQEAERVADESKSQLQRQLLEHEQFRSVFLVKARQN